MAKIDDLISHVADPGLRAQLNAAVSEIRDNRHFGLVFEHHIPETVLLPGFRVKKGALVQRSDESKDDQWIVEKIAKNVATLRGSRSGEITTANVEELVVVKPFGDAIYPSLTPLGTLPRGGSKPWHAIINAENYHALHLLLYLYEGKVDCIYLDPPYNTGAQDWTYNNRFVDDNDSYRHSKWLSFMDKRLRLAKRLLKRDGVLIITIDEHELNHLAVLMEQLFSDYQRPMVTIVISAAGNNSDNFSRVEEHAIFCCPKIGREVITGASVDFLPEAGDLFADSESVDEGPTTDDGDDDDDEQEDYYVAAAEGGTRVLVENARRRGAESLRADRASMFFPIYIDDEQKKVVRIGKPIPLGEEPDFSRKDGLLPVWPIDSSKAHRRWRWGYEEMVAAASKGELKVGKYNPKRGSWTINRVETKPDAVFKKLKTVWRHTSHAAGTHGSGLLQKFLGSSQVFSFPKSVYAVRDCLAAVVRTRPEALIVDVFAGSATTFHATCLLNAADGGTRRCVLVTNNEVDPNVAASLRAEGHFRGDPQFEAHGIFEKVARPRCEAVVTGKRSDGTGVPGKHLGGRPHAQGFDENVEFYRLDYLDPNDVNLGRQFEAVLPLLWLAAGGKGSRPTATSKVR